MAIVNFQYSKIQVERKEQPTGAISVTPNISLKNVKEKKLNMVSKETNALQAEFHFELQYAPNFGSIILEGVITGMFSPEKTAETLKLWDEKKTLPKDILTVIMNTIFSRCQLQAIILAKDINLPSPVRLPKLNIEETTKKDEK
ncbi:MAG: hypothetical protein ACMXYE_03125 [Candidatus Woesearchaeota archaeon]